MKPAPYPFGHGEILSKQMSFDAGHHFTLIGLNVWRMSKASLQWFVHFWRFQNWRFWVFCWHFGQKSKQTADFQKKGFYTNDRLLMLYVLASIVFLYHQWLRWYAEMLVWFVRQGGVCKLNWVPIDQFQISIFCAKWVFRN